MLCHTYRERLAALRKAKGLTQQALADLVGLHTMQIHRYEAGRASPRSMSSAA
jgi:transcriptional regulator with XRE-family HTH domain